MNVIIQNILAFSALTIALLYLFKNFVWWPKKKISKACGGDNGCGCH
ncbi:MAG: FeoB-associated Cys-rich membrane protein [Winogradskyella sp.]